MLYSTKDTSNTINVTVNPLPLASILRLQQYNFCSRNNVLPSQSGDRLSVVNGVLDTITVTESGKYKVTITDTNGCSNALK